MPRLHHRKPEHAAEVNEFGRGLSKRQRLVSSALFSETFARKRRRAGRLMVLWLREEEGASLRLGVVSSKKIHRRAVQRNFARRRMREAYRQLRPYFSGNFDVVLVARRNLLSSNWKEMISELLHLASCLGILSAENLEAARQEFQIFHDQKPTHKPAGKCGGSTN